VPHYSVINTCPHKRRKNPGTPPPAVCYTVGNSAYYTRPGPLLPITLIVLRRRYGGGLYCPSPSPPGFPLSKTNRRGLLSPLRYAPFPRSLQTLLRHVVSHCSCMCPTVPKLPYYKELRQPPCSPMCLYVPQCSSVLIYIAVISAVNFPLTQLLLIKNRCFLPPGSILKTPLFALQWPVEQRECLLPYHSTPNHKLVRHKPFFHFLKACPQEDQKVKIALRNFPKSLTPPFLLTAAFTPKCYTIRNNRRQQEPRHPAPNCINTVGNSAH
jgi:hypothetical protein